MANEFGKVKEKIEKSGYFKVPNYIIESGTWARMSNEEKSVYIVYCYYARGGKSFNVDEDEISITGITKNKVIEKSGIGRLINNA